MTFSHRSKRLLGPQAALSSVRPEDWKALYTHPSAQSRQAFFTQAPISPLLFIGLSDPDFYVAKATLFRLAEEASRTAPAWFEHAFRLFWNRPLDRLDILRLEASAKALSLFHQTHPRASSAIGSDAFSKIVCAHHQTFSNFPSLESSNLLVHHLPFLSFTPNERQTHSVLDLIAHTSYPNLWRTQRERSRLLEALPDSLPLKARPAL
jgi:hypothetical protein